jgi:hypothetical protein
MTTVAAVMDGLAGVPARQGGQLVVITGGATGADAEAYHVARHHGYETEVYLADWESYGRAAGPIRNQRMLDEGKPDIVVAFKNDLDPTLSKGGTEHMLKIAQAAGVPTIWVGSKR